MPDQPTVAPSAAADGDSADFRPKQICVQMSPGDLDRVAELAQARGVSRRKLVREHLLPYLASIAAGELAPPEKVQTPPARPVKNVCFRLKHRVWWDLQGVLARAGISQRQLCYTLLRPLLAEEVVSGQ